jgi:flagellar biosynthesis protein FlhA
MWIASGFLAILGLVPGLPALPFLALAAMTAGAAWLTGPARDESAEAIVQTLPAREEVPARDAAVRDLLQIDPVELELGYALIPLVDGSGTGDLLDRIRLLRKQAALDLGILVPPIRIRDDVRLGPDQYVVKVRGTEVARGEVMPRLLLALDTGALAGEPDGIRTVDPTFGMPAWWIGPDRRDEAESMGCTVVEPSTVIATHLMETLRTAAADLLGRQDVQELVEALKESYPALIEEVIPDRVPLGVLHRVLQRLLREGVPIRDLVTILETLADVTEHTKDPEVLSEHVRRALAAVIGDSLQDEEGRVRGITLGPRLEAALMGFFNPRPTKDGVRTVLDPDVLATLLGRLDALTRRHSDGGRPVPVITPPGLRVGVRRLIEPVMPRVPVVSLAELPAHVNLQSIATWEMDHAA